MSILNRKRDMMYMTFFLIHVPVIFLVDAYPLWPTSLIPSFMHDIRTFYIETYGDRFFISPPSWFRMYVWMEVVYHVPLSVWAIGALLRDDPKVPVQLLIFAVATVMTTSTCIADYMAWSGFSNAEKLELGKLYVPYLALSVFMGVDMYGRLTAAVSCNKAQASKKTK